MNFSQAELLIKEFGQTIGLPELVLDEESRCDLMVDEEILISMEFQTQEQILLLVAPVGDPLQSFPQKMLAFLLTHNLSCVANGEPVLGLEPESAHLLLVDRVSSQEMNCERLQAVIERFIDAVEYWQSEMREEIWQAFQWGVTSEGASASDAFNVPPRPGNFVPV